jgi:alkaline phosphatase D
MTINRRTFVTSSAFAAGAAAIGASPASALTRRSANLVQQRLTLPSGVQTGDVSAHSAVLWARSSGPGRLVARIISGSQVREAKGGWADAGTDYTAKLPLAGLAPGREYDVRIQFESEDGTRGEVGRSGFRTASIAGGATSFVWTADTCGQGWGINRDLGGLLGYRAMHETNPDFFIQAGDTVYSDGPIQAEVVEPDGQVWRNLVTPEVSKVAESLEEFRGRQRYTFMDDNVRAMYADVPVIAQWDDHETHNNWYPGQTPNAGWMSSRHARDEPGRSTCRSRTPVPTEAATASPPRASTARSAAGQNSTCSAWTCGPSRTRTRPVSSLSSRTSWGRSRRTG